MEADPRHAELLIEQLGLETDSGVGIPGLAGADEDDLDSDAPLEGLDVNLYRGVIARCNYVGIDRPNCLFAIKKGCRNTSKPTTG